MRCKSTRCAVQPHACGEKRAAAKTDCIHNGSTPRMWGKEIFSKIFQHEDRFNPTRVGKSKTEEPVQIGDPVQPHACGEKVWFCFLLQFRARFNPTRVGKRGTSTPIFLSLTVQPHACGEKMSASVIMCALSVQPHACGEKRLRLMFLIDVVGSTPRMWGKVFGASCIAWRIRFNPTHVGKST